LVGLRLTEYAFEDLFAGHCGAKKSEAWREWHLGRWEFENGKKLFGRDLVPAFAAVLWDHKVICMILVYNASRS
jgi:hypothetical protein